MTQVVVAKLGAPRRRAAVGAWLERYDGFTFFTVMVTAGVALAGIIVCIVGLFRSIGPNNGDELPAIGYELGLLGVAVAVLWWWTAIGLMSKYAVTGAGDHYDEVKRTHDALALIRKSSNIQLRAAADLLVADLVVILDDKVDYDSGLAWQRVNRLEKLAEEAKVELADVRRLRLDNHTLEYADEVLESVKHARKELSG